MEEVQEFIKDCGVYFLATVEGNQPRVRPFGTMEIFEGKLYIQTSKTKNVSKQIEKNPLVEICAYKNGTWLRISGKLVRDDRIEAKRDMLTKNPSLKDLYSETDPNSEVLYFSEAKAVFYSFVEEPRVIEL